MKKMICKKSNSFEKSALVVFALSMFANAMHAVFHVLSGKLLGTFDYGIINVVNSYVTYLGVFCGPIATMACCYSAKLRADRKQEAGFIKWIIKYSFLIELIISLIGIVLAFISKSLLGEEVFKVVIFIVLLLPSNSFYVILLSIVQGLQKFTMHGIIGVVFYGIKTFVGIILMLAGWGTIGVVFAMLISQLVCVGICICILRDYLKEKTLEKEYTSRNLLEFYGSIFFLQIFYFFYINGGEIIILNFFFDNHAVGEYSSVAMLCKFLFYAVTPITTVLLPNVAEKKSMGINTTKILRKAIIYILLLAACFGIGMYVLGKKALIFLYGVQYTNAIQYIPAAFYYTFSIVVLSVMYSYHTAIANTKKMTIALLVASVAMFVFTLLFHNDLKHLLVMISILLGIVDIYSFIIAKG